MGFFGRLTARTDEQPQPPAYEPLPPGTVRDPEAIQDSAPDPDEADSDSRFW